MAQRRPHSRSGPAAGQAAARGADRIEDLEQAAREQAARGGEHPAAPSEQGQQPFAGRGQFTGRSVPPQEAAPPAGLQALETALASAVHERDEFRSDLQRLAAEFDNFRKRSAREREQAATGAESKLMAELLAVVDDIERALSQSATEQESALVDGIRMVHTRLQGVLAQHGLSEIAADGAFDPQLHDAMMMQPTADVEEGHIVSVVQKGYRLGDRILRHAKVVVAAAPEG